MLRLPPTPRGSNRIRLTPGMVLAMFAALSVLLPIGFWNRYVFLESNSPFLLVLTLVIALTAWSGRLPKGIGVVGWVLVGFLFLIAYAWAHLDHPLNPDFQLPSGSQPGISHVFNLGMFAGLFLSGVLLGAKRSRFSLFIWALIVGYALAFIIRNSADINALQSGYNLSPGVVLCTLVPFVVFRAAPSSPVTRKIAMIVFAIAILWLAVIGARAAVVALMVFGATVVAWPLFTTSRFRFYSVFWGLLGLILAGYVIYLTNVEAGAPGITVASGIGVLDKSLGTRVDIWNHLFYLMGEHWTVGWGTDSATEDVAPLTFLDFSGRRGDLSSHSMFFEIVYRLGLVGLFGMLNILFAIWRLLWRGRSTWGARVAGATMLSVFFLGSTGGILLFSVVPLRSGFVWLTLGIGVGASLQSINAVRNKARAPRGIDAPFAPAATSGSVE